MRTIKPQNVNVMYHRTKTQGHSHTKYKISQWHDRWRPHASQWPKPAYHHSPLTESARPEHEPIPKPELTISQNPTRETKECVDRVRSYPPELSPKATPAAPSYP